MCGIFGMAANSNVLNTLIEGLHRLEYRGYDSAGVVILNDNRLNRARTPGRVADLENLVRDKPIAGCVGIAHTRWATHGVPDEINAHPHISQNRIAIVHNGIIENHEDLRKAQVEAGFEIVSSTDTEVIAHQIMWHLRQEKDLLKAVWLAGRDVIGSYALGVVDAETPDRIIAVRNGSPLLIGAGENAQYIASDIQAMAPNISSFIPIENGEVAVITSAGSSLYDHNLKPIKRKAQKVESQFYAGGLCGYTHYMLKEIYEQPRVAADILEGRLLDRQVPDNVFGEKAETILPQVQNIQIIACGSSYHAAMVGKYWFEELIGVACQVEIASEFRYRTNLPHPNSLLVAISQSGETADTLSAHEWAMKHDYLASLAICNVAHSTLVRETDINLLTHAGPEIGVASTKAFTAQLIALLLLVTALAKHKKGKENIQAGLVEQLRNLPSRLTQVFDLIDDIEALAVKFVDKQHVLFLGRGQYYPIALEGALKMKEITYAHAEGYPAGELKHGPLALVDKDMPVVAVAPNDHLLHKLRANLSEVEARGGQLHVFADLKSGFKESDVSTLIKLNALENTVAPIVFAVPLQLLAYHMAVIKGTDVDKPRNLAKSVTVE